MKCPLLASVLLALGATLASAQWGNRFAPIQGTTPQAASYTGPGDVVASALAWWGLRCYNSAYTGNVADVWDGATGSTTHTLITCSSGGVLVTSSPTAIATTCASSCRVKTLYDQSGALSCGGAACNLAQATNANRPAYTLNCNGSLPCMTLTAANSNYLIKSATTLGQAQPFTYSSVINFTSVTPAYAAFSMDNGTALVEIYSFSSALNMYAGSNFGPAISAATWYAFQAIFNGASSVAYVNGASTSGNALTGALVSSYGILMGADTATAPADFMDGKIEEVGIWGSGFSAGNQSAMNANQRAYYGF